MAREMLPVALDLFAAQIRSFPAVNPARFSATLP